MFAPLSDVFTKNGHTIGGAVFQVGVLYFKLWCCVSSWGAVFQVGVLYFKLGCCISCRGAVFHASGAVLCN